MSNGVMFVLANLRKVPPRSLAYLTSLPTDTNTIGSLPADPFKACVSAALRWGLMFLLLLATTVCLGANPTILESETSGEVMSGRFQPYPGYLSHGNSALRGDSADVNRFRFMPRVEHRGWYRLSVFWPIDARSSDAVTVAISHTGGIDQIPIDQSQGGGGWADLGVFALTADSYVDLSGPAGAVVVADALRLEFVGDQRPALSLETATLPIADAGRPYSEHLTTVGGVAPYFWWIEGQLPSGIHLDAVTGTLAGTPDQYGHYEFAVHVMDSAGAEDTRRYELYVVAGDRLSQPAAPRRYRAPPAEALTKASDAPIALQSLSVTAEGGPDLSELIAILAALPEGNWARVNLNFYRDVWAPPELQPLWRCCPANPERIIAAWSSFAWDQNRGDLLLYGGGHANSSGNEVYRWRGTTRMWERASLPSELIFDDVINDFIPIDGMDAAPPSAHTYDNSVFAPLIDRLVTFGGAAHGNGGAYKTWDENNPGGKRRTGPYFFDPSRADPNRVGGTTGSHVQRVAPYPEIMGGEMWENRDLLRTQPLGTPIPMNHVNGGTAYTEENGRDVIYVAANAGGTGCVLYRYTINNLNDPTQDTWELVGRYFNAVAGSGPAAYDPILKVFVKIQDSSFVYWNLNTPGPKNNNEIFQAVDLSGGFPLDLLKRFGMDHDPRRQRFLLWGGGGDVWALIPPPTVSRAGWSLVRQPTPSGSIPDPDPGTGIQGKWKYIPNLDAFMGLQGPSDGNIWLYKPVGWQAPGAGGTQPPTVVLTAPPAGSAFTSGASVALSANVGNDANASVTQVQFFANGTLIGQSTAPYTLTWTPTAAGSYSLTATAIDPLDGNAISTPVTVTITDTSGAVTLTLQDGLNGYTATRDSYIDRYSPTANFGTRTTLRDRSPWLQMLLDFAVFQSEGGPVPDGAGIESVILSLYKTSVYDHSYRLSQLLVDWSETTVTWNQRLAGQSWSSAGAEGLGTDIAIDADAEASIGWSPGWVSFDITTVLQARNSGAAHHGWILDSLGGNFNIKAFISRESTTDPSLRPKLTIRYH